ncbi:TetR/AcrR family transcriptional regulator [Actinacidiphila rubida]|uniref:Transcriptional regulator, TetR family n=1 Tax=Actinacidiphila rubida TaxID=310780 RepID=A0A1H8DN25_9ACTN|nr:TetR/AcrR family transcriptional regulator [Actinacidiphila rubida]SEN08204.1 transcriptional regulator, TetR family [Actinacidiphila rubida]
MAQLRELKKQQTRRSITHAATALFMERGFEATTIAEVAEVAGVSKMTVTNYFPRKEDLFFDMHEEVVTGPARAVAARRVGESALDAVRRDYLAAVERHDPLLGWTQPGFTRLIDDSPVLRARLRELFDHQEQALSVVIAAGAGEEPDAFVPRHAAAQLGTVLRLLFTEAQRRVRRGACEEEVFAALDATAREAFGRLEPSLAGYAVRTSQVEVEVEVGHGDEDGDGVGDEDS